MDILKMIFMGHEMSQEAADAIRHTLDGKTYAETAEVTGIDRSKIKRLVGYWRTRGILIPKVGRSKHKRPPQKLTAKTMMAIELANKGVTNHQIAEVVGGDAHSISRLLSYHRCKGDRIAPYQLPLDEYELLHKTGRTQREIAAEIGIGRRKAASCHRSLVLQGRLPDRAKRKAKQRGEDKWALALGRKPLY